MEEPGTDVALGALAPGARRSERPARVKIAIAAAVVLLLAAGAAAVLVTILGDHGNVERVPGVQVHTRAGSASASRTPSPTATPIFVHVVGAVRNPGLFQLHAGARVIDAISAAGGLDDTADPAAVNLAGPVTDGQQVRIPHVGEAVPDVPQPVSGGAAAGGMASGGKVNINTASAEQLETLPGIGEVMAERIVDWRTEHGPFDSVDGLLDVSGIGEKTLAELKDLVTV